ncbi:uncharacterized protein LOC110754863 isoform X1 [Prunus avium]|uniref:Uncharacterized protein LOC110754863 isoform X1 n=1 Tax=Prunus avium TaxID=42229 RepID=A0A6P5S3V4_PRUAV|nr:uncharacterized protein LOC110754863 isoform X1 [Prunus avium]
MERTELFIEENNDLPRPPPDLGVEENNDLVVLYDLEKSESLYMGFSKVAYDINNKLDKLVSLIAGGNLLSSPSHEPPTDEIGNLELLKILWKVSGKVDVLMHMLGK